MATYTDNYALVKPTYGELADVAVINGNMDTIDGIMHSNRTMLAPAFSQTEDYAVGDVVVYEGNLYRFIVPHTAGNWDGSEVEQTTLGEEVATKGGADVTKTASGNPIEISDAASAPLVKCDVTISPQQDLHGYDKPWVGGAGKNKIPDGTDTTNGYVSGALLQSNGNTTANGSYDISEYFPVTVGTSYTYCSYPNTSGGVVSMCFYDSSKQYISGIAIGNGVATLEAPSNAAYCRATIPSSLNTTYKLLVCVGTTKPTEWEPYSNICPISGYSSVGVEVRGKNYVDTTKTSTANGYYSGGYLSNSGSVVSNASYFISEYCEIEPSKTYKLSDLIGYGASYAFYTSNKTLISAHAYANQTTITKEAPDNAKYIRMSFTSDNRATIKFELNDVTPVTYTISLGGTYYSGQIDVVKGVLVATRGYDEFDGTASVTITRSGYSNWYYTIANGGYAGANTANVLSNKYVGAGVTDNTDVLGVRKQTSGSVRVRVGGTEPADVSGFLAELADTHLQVVYPLTTPLEIPLTPTVISSLLGNNTMWTDGDNLEVEYITQEFQPIVDLIESGNGHTYSTSEQIVGKWTDGKDIYERVFDWSSDPINIPAGGWSNTPILTADIDSIISIRGISPTKTMWNNLASAVDSGTYVTILNPRADTQITVEKAIIQYTKPSSNTRSLNTLNLTKSAVTEEIPEEIANAEYEEKPEINEADDDAPTEVER